MYFYRYRLTRQLTKKPILNCAFKNKYNARVDKQTQVRKYKDPWFYLQTIKLL